MAVQVLGMKWRERERERERMIGGGEAIKERYQSR